MNQRYLMALDQGTTSSRAILFTFEGSVISSCAIEFPQHYPRPGWVEHDPADILHTQIEAMRACVRKAQIDPKEIAGIGITNQRETTLIWDRDTGLPLHPAIVWQCRRTADRVDRLINDGCGDMIRRRTGLFPDAYFSGTKLAWLLDHLSLRSKAKNGEICFGTVDSFLCWNLVEGHPHVTDATNASRTMLYDIEKQDWDDDLLKMLDIPRQMLPQVVDSVHRVGYLHQDILGERIPVSSIAGDQHAALFGQACFDEGMVKNTYGTGCFMLMNIGSHFRLSSSKLLTTTAWRIDGKTTYAFEGSVFMSGAAVQWLRDEMKMISRADETEGLAFSVHDTGGVYLVPAFAGLGAPYWDMYARGTLVGVTRGTGKAHIARAVLESIAYQSADLFNVMKNDCSAMTPILRVDGGASANRFLMQFQADILNTVVQRPAVSETTALGAALMCGLALGIYPSIKATARGWHSADTYDPGMTDKERNKCLKGWKRAVDAALFWSSLQDKTEDIIE